MFDLAAETADYLVDKPELADDLCPWWWLKIRFRDAKSKPFIGKTW